MPKLLEITKEQYLELRDLGVPVAVRMCDDEEVTTSLSRGGDAVYYAPYPLTWNYVVSKHTSRFFTLVDSE